jgi:hypothetical protein
MRAKEFAFEGAMTPSIANLVSVLDDLRSRTDQIRVDGLINLVRRIPGSEMFNVDLLKNAYENNDTIKNMIRNIGDDDSGVKYVYLKSLEGSEDQLPSDEPSNDDFGSGRNPEQTVSSMAKRAAKKRS